MLFEKRTCSPIKLLKRTGGRIEEFFKSLIPAETSPQQKSRRRKLILGDLQPSRDAVGGASFPPRASGPGAARFGEQPREISALQSAIRALHGCEAVYRRSEAVRDKFHPYAVWDGFVCVFKLLNHATAKYCYAWRFKEGEETKFAAVLETPPVACAESAVRFAICRDDSSPRIN